MTVKRVIFIRPGETDWNRELRWQGVVAIPLNEHGRQQAGRLANYVRNIGMSALYTSDLRRATETAAILVAKLGFAPVLDGRLRERDIGDWQGLTPDEMSTWYPTEYDLLRSDPENYRVPGGESRNDVRKRMLAAFKDIAAGDRGETVGILSHTTAIHSLLSEIIPGGFSRPVAVSNTSVTTISLSDDGSWQLVTADDVLHLEGLEAKISPELGEKNDTGD